VRILGGCGVTCITSSRQPPLRAEGLPWFLAHRICSVYKELSWLFKNLHQFAASSRQQGRHNSYSEQTRWRAGAIAEWRRNAEPSPLARWQCCALGTAAAVRWRPLPPHGSYRRHWRWRMRRSGCCHTSACGIAIRGHVLHHRFLPRRPNAERLGAKVAAPRRVSLPPCARWQRSCRC
jgi:hypothetical protein